MSDTELSAKDSTIPDLSDLLDKVDFEKHPVSHGIDIADEPDFGVHKWGALAFDLVANPMLQEEIIAKYRLSPTQFALLMRNEVFLAVYEDTKSSIKALAANGGFQLNTRRLAELGLTAIKEVMVNGSYNEKMRAVELATRYAGLDPSLNKKDKDVQVNTGVQLVVNFSDQLPAPAAFSKGSNVIIEAVADEVE